MENLDKKICPRCKRMLTIDSFYKMRSGEYWDLCKKCLGAHVDAFNPETFLWILEKGDYPYVESEWNLTRDDDYRKKGPEKFSHVAVLGKYIAKMKLRQWGKFGWGDEEAIAEEMGIKAEKKATEKHKERDEFYQRLYENGRITEAEFKTLTSVEYQRGLAEAAAQAKDSNPYVGPNNPFDENYFLLEGELPDLAASLSQENKVALAMKWGRLYKPEEWIALEQDYKKMMESFDIQDADSQNTLILLCKTNLKANQCIDNGDIEGFQKLSKVSESLRKTANFTAAQNKEQKGNFVDSIGELIAICEKEGFIPRYPTDIPQDKVDQTLKDQKNYIYKLVTEDLGFGTQIENALKRIEIQKQLEEEERVRAEKEGDSYNPYEDTIHDRDLIAFAEDVQAQLLDDMEEEEEE